jgi:hypothetical protein
MTTAEKVTRVARGMRGWDRMWAALAAMYGGDPVCRCPDTGETWQYMDTITDALGRPVEHEFRHRHIDARKYGRMQGHGRRYCVVPALHDDFAQVDQEAQV